ncbi:MAG: hypothetical protein RIS35_938 [Pseudomonadota bacterium]
MTTSTLAPLAESTVIRNGTSLIDLGGTLQVGAAIVTLPGGSILVAGQAWTSKSDLIDLCLVRLRADGVVDADFGIDGALLIPVVPGSDDLGRSLTVLPDQTLVLAGSSFDPAAAAYDYVAVGLTLQGAPIAGFGTGGAAQTGPASDTSDQLRILLRQTDGKLLMIGDSNNPATGTQDFSVVRLTAAGGLDTSFGKAGAALLATLDSWEYAGGAVLQPDGKLLIAGSRSIGSSYDLQVVRLKTDGQPDTAFGQSGISTIDVASGSGDRGGMVALQPGPTGADPWILLAGTSYDSTRKTYAFSLVRMDGSGALDAGAGGFGNGGKVLVPMGSGSLNLAGLEVRPTDGSIYLVGDRFAASTASRDLCVIRLRADGTLDPGFGNNGIVVVPISGSDESARGLSLQADASLLIVGNSSGGEKQGIRVVKLTPDGRLDTGFGQASSPDPVVGTVASERLEGGEADDAIYGLGGADTLAGFGGDDLLDGGDGLDTAVFTGALSGYTLSRNGATLTVTDRTAGRDGTDTGTNLERLQFADMGVNLTVQAAGASIPQPALDRLCELYVGFFGRVPAADGLENWISQYKGGKALDSIANDFYGIGSSEQLRMYTGYWDTVNGRELSNPDYVRIVYRNVLGREGLEGGITYWANQLAGPEAKTRGELVSTMLDAAHGLKTDTDWGWVADLLDDRIVISKRVALEWGLNYASTPQQAIERGMQIAGAVTESANPNPLYAAIPVKTFDFEAAVELVGIDPARVDLIA